MPFTVHDIPDQTGKLVVITGATGGLGYETALALAGANATIVLTGRNARKGADALARIRAIYPGADISYDTLDVGSLGSVEEFARHFSAAHDRLDILVNNAGISHVGNVETTTPEDMDRLFRVNVMGVYHGSRAAVPIMLRQGGGVILNMCSIAALVGIEDRFAYSMTKGAVLTMTRSIAVDYVKRGIRCNCICPARVHTPFVDGYLAKNYPGREQEMLQALSAYQPIGRMGLPGDIAPLALYLCSDEASFITGAAYPIDGGVTAV
jgi:2-keto-3-deoxy-L-fuconate dehydrogenase